VRGVAAAKVRGRAEELSRLVGHLLDNAARYGRTRVVVTVTPVDDWAGQWVRLTVDDDGPGVPIKDREEVFERFGRLEDGRSRDCGGAGLGLSVVKRIAERHGGSTRVTEGPLGGARFAIELPAGSAESTARGESGRPDGSEE
jgi:signal transduction histidine kinase